MKPCCGSPGQRRPTPEGGSGINFVQDTNQVETTTQLNTNQVDTATQLNHVELTWEPNPAGQPDVFQDLLTIQWGVDQVNETGRSVGGSAGRQRGIATRRR